MIKLKQAVIVEGKYDKMKLTQIIDATIIVTGGFRIFKDKKTAELIKAYAQTSGIVIATDSDSAGFKIRNYIRSYVKDGNITNIYIPDIYGKERRKATPSAENKLGLEGVPNDILISLFENLGGITVDENEPKITKQTLYEDGLTGSENSSSMRLALLKELNLPEHLTTNALIPVLNSLLGYKSYKLLIDKLFKSEENK